ncbi:DALR anticodon-binding domain-containing protein 3 [Homalodisca vitripennis]|nr:DALR anticodon-binding domain-containing protein 3 [Homalodisca vitripennis]KAG8301378.1 DALR anticodon-binding domain-containing protein 3 [Homalodisca vitripennis]
MTNVRYSRFYISATTEIARSPLHRATTSGHCQPIFFVYYASQKQAFPFTGAPFVLYNYARLSAILEKFDYCVAESMFRPLPSLDDINYSLFTEEDEWSLVFDLLAEWPAVVTECQNLTRPGLHRLTGFLSTLASIFSVYYRHTRVLNEGLPHMVPLMEARIHLLLAIRQVFLNAFSLLGIVAPTSM